MSNGKSLKPILCVYLVCVIAVLGGCAIQRGEVLGDGALGYDDEVFVSIPEDEYFWIAPPPGGPHDAQPAATQIPKQGIWLREGWFVVEFQCFTPKDAPRRDVVDPILPETEDEKTLFIHAGHRYLLSCSDTKVGKIQLKEQDDTKPQ